MAKFNLKADYQPTKEQERVVNELTEAFRAGVNNQVLLGVTGSGKTFTAANVIQKLGRPALIISHNKTLAAQLYQELKSFFPDNAVSYFVSYYDYYQPEAYVPSTDTYIEKDADINELIDKLRLAATTNILTRDDTIVVASVSCIYNIGAPAEYKHFIFEISPGLKIGRRDVIDRLVLLQYERSDYGFMRGTFRVKGDIVDIFPAYQDEAVRIELGEDSIKKVTIINPVSGEILKESLEKSFYLYPAKLYITDPEKRLGVFEEIQKDLKKRVQELMVEGKEFEARRLFQRTNYDLEMIKEVGYVKGIENYSRYFDGRKPGDAPNSLVDYFNYAYGKDWLTIVDESHITFPQIRGMYAGDASRKQMLVDYGFRLPSTFDNRPLKFEEFMRRIPGFLATSATPAEWEVNQATEAARHLGRKGVVEQLLRPTGIPDPVVEIRPTKNQVADVIEEIKKRAEKGQRTLVTTLTKRTAEDLTQYLVEKGLKVQYLHSDVKTLERSDILDNLRRGEYDCLVGINLLREGLDLPEVALVAILDADKEGFLRSDVSLIQTMGRAARHVEGEVILYADNVTGSMQRALDEVARRRNYQLAMNKKLRITPTSIQKPLREKVIEADEETFDPLATGITETTFQSLPHIETESLTPMDKKRLVGKLRKEMLAAATELNFELAAEIRDKIKEIEI